MTTYADVKKQIAQLEKKAADLRKVEVAKAVANIREQMAKYELTVDDIAPVKSSKGGKFAAPSAKVKVAKPAKYMDPKSGKTWTGHGKAPGWIAAATKAGRRDDFLIGKGTQAKDSKPSDKSKSMKPVAAKKVVAKSVVNKKSKVVAKKPPMAKKASATIKNPPAVAKGKAVVETKRLVAKNPAKATVKAKSVSKPETKPSAPMKPSKKTRTKPEPATTKAQQMATA